MTDNEKLSLQMLRPLIGPLLQSLDKNELLELLAQASLVSQVGAEKIKDIIEKQIDSNDVSSEDVVFLALYALAQAEEEEVTPR